MKFSIEKINKNTSALILEEENLNTLIAPGFKSEIIFLINEGVKVLILDLSFVDYVDSAGLQSILNGARYLQKSNPDYKRGDFIWIGKMKPAVDKLFKISRLETLIIHIEDFEVAKDYLMTGVYK